MEPLYKDIVAGNAKVDNKVFFMKQEISNACGTFALFHALGQHINKIMMGKGFNEFFEIIFLDESGPFAKWYKEAKALGVNDRSKSLATNQDLAVAHEDCATSGETRADVEKVEYHFICYTNVDGTLYELGTFLDINNKD